MGNDFDWLDSPFLQAVRSSGHRSLPCFIIWELVEPPTLDLRVFMHRRNFVIGLIGLTLGFLDPGAPVASNRPDPIVAGLASKLAGLALLRWCCWSASDRRDALPVQYISARWLVCLNCLGFAWTFYWIGLFDDPHSYEELFWPMVVEGIFLVLLYSGDGAHCTACPAR
ncbi:MAG: hypothetical protein MRJ92_07400 [Nitrospira sp.]|nr:hypothetical protein [Nitrospira sp.]